MSKIHVDEVVKKGEFYPLIVNFQNGYLTENFPTLACNINYNEDNRKISLATELEDTLYVGEEDNDDVGNTFIVARNKNTGKVRIIEVGCAQLKPYFYTEKRTTSVLETSAMELSRKFGSKKSKQIMEQKNRMKVDVKTVTEQMKHVTKNISEEKVDLAQYVVENSDDFYIPPINRDAANVNDIYDIDRILTTEQYDKIYSELESKDYEAEYHPAVKEVLAERGNLNHKETVLAVYASSLFTIFSMNSRDLAKKSCVICSVSITLNNLIFANFCQTGARTRTRPAKYKDKAICHAIVFCLLLQNKIDIEKMSVNLKITSKFAMTKAKATLATVTGSGTKKFAMLKLPLPSYKPFRRRSANF